MRLFVGSLGYNVTNEQLKAFFSEVGEVASATVIIDRATQQSKGFAFVEMTNLSEGQRAIKELNGKELDGRAINVSAARERNDQPSRSYGSQSKFNNRSSR